MVFIWDAILSTVELKFGNWLTGAGALGTGAPG